MFRWVLPVAVLFALVTLLGCGSSGGGGAGTGDPVEVEVGATLDSVITDLEALNFQKVKTDWLDTNMTYHRVNTAPGVLSDFSNRLQAFLGKVQSLSFAVNNRGIESTGEAGAQMLGDLTYSYVPTGANASVEVSEKIYMTFQRVGKWGVFSIGSPQYPTTFPPEL